MLAATAAGNPGPVAGPVTWSAHLIGTHPGAATAAFGTVQLLLAPGIAWRPTVRRPARAPGHCRGPAADPAGRLIPQLRWNPRMRSN